MLRPEVDHTAPLAVPKKGSLISGGAMRCLLDVHNRRHGGDEGTAGLARAKEAEDRLDAYERGELGSVSAEEVFARVDRQRGK